MAETRTVDVAWRLALSGTAGRLAAFPVEGSLVQLTSMLAMGQLSLLLRDRVYSHYADAPFSELEEGVAEVEVEIIVVADSWPDKVSGLRWKDVRVDHSDFTGLGLLREVIGLENDVEPADGVRAEIRVETKVNEVVDGTFVFVGLRSFFDVWCAYSGNLMVNGVAVEPRSVWLFADFHTPLQHVEVGEAFMMPVMAAQYTAVHLRFELQEVPSLVPILVDFHAVVAMVGTPELRRHISEEDHVSRRGWALSGGCVVCSLPPVFLDANFSVFTDEFAVPAPHSYEYAVAPESRENACLTDSLSTHDGWHRAKNP
jgi:hypothetical protein